MTTNINQKCCTLIELLVVIGIIAVLSVVVLLTLNPAELLRQARDSTRISNRCALSSALSLYVSDVETSYNMGDGDFCYQDVDTNIAVGQTWGEGCDPDDWQNPFGLESRFAAGTVQDAPAAASLRNVNGTGWIPVNFTLISSGAPMNRLPVDPNPSLTKDRFYAYRAGVPLGSSAVCDAVGDTACTVFEINATMESTKFASGGGGNVEGTDGGDRADLFEVGTRLNL